MAFSNIDRTSEVDMCYSEILVKSTDYCNYFTKHPYTILQRKECWTCKFSNFGDESGSITDTGVCRYKVLNQNNTTEVI